MPVKSYLERYVVLSGLTLVAAAGAPDSSLVCSKRKRQLRVRFRVEGVPEYPRFTKGLEVGADLTDFFVPLAFRESRPRWSNYIR